jgi:hypothetical protein
VLQTEDLFLAASGLVRGGELVEVRVHGLNGRRMAVFHIEGPGMEEVEREYHRGCSVVLDLRLLKTEVVRLKNLAFQVLREEESRHAGEQRRYRAHPLGEPHRRGPR